MTSRDFTQWLRGFVDGAPEYNIDSKQWDLLKSKLAEVDDSKFEETPGMFQIHSGPSYPGPIEFPYPGAPVVPYREDVISGTDTPPWSCTGTTVNLQNGAWQYTTTHQKLLVDEKSAEEKNKIVE